MLYLALVNETGTERRPETVYLTLSRETEKALGFSSVSSRFGGGESLTWVPRSGILAVGSAAIVFSAAWATEKFRFATPDGKFQSFGFRYPEGYGLEAVQQFVASCLAEGYTPSQEEIDVLSRKPVAAPAKAARFTAGMNRRAWAIRREAAARLGVALMTISWGECLRMARAGE